MVVVVTGVVSEGVVMIVRLLTVGSSIDVVRMVVVVVGGLVGVDVVLVMVVCAVAWFGSVVVVLVMSDDVLGDDALIFLGGSINDCIDIT